MAMQGSPEAVHNIWETMEKVEKRLHEEAELMRNIKNASIMVGWDDEKGQAFQELMDRIALLIEMPLEPLTKTVPKLKELEQLMRDYNNLPLG